MITINAEHQRALDMLEVSQNRINALLRALGNAERDTIAMARQIEQHRLRTTALLLTLDVAADAFDDYARLHEAKGTPESAVKAQTNRRLADQMRQAMAEPDQRQQAAP